MAAMQKLYSKMQAIISVFLFEEVSTEKIQLIRGTFHGMPVESVV